MTWEQRVLAGDPTFPATQQIPDFPLRAVRGADRSARHPLRRPDASRAPGTRRSPPTGRCVLEVDCRPARCRRCRRTSARAGEEDGEALIEGDPDAAGIDARVAQGQAARSSSEPAAGETARSMRRRRRDRALAARPTRSPRTRRSRTGRSSGTRPRCRGRGRTRAARPGSASRYADAATARLVARMLAELRAWDATRSAVRRHTAAMVEALRNIGPARARVDGDLGGRHRALGSEGAAPRAAARRRCSARCATRFRSTAAAASPLLARAARRSSSAAGSQRDPAREDEGRPRPGAPTSTRVQAAREAIGDGRRALRRRERRVSPKQALALAERVRRAGRDAGSRSRSPPTTSTGFGSCATAAPAGHGHRRGRIRLRPAYFRRMLEAGAVDVPPGGRDALRRDHRLPAAAALCEAHGLAALGALRAAAARPRVLRVPRVPAPRVLPRPRPHRAHALRRRARARGRRAPARPVAARARASSSSAGRRAVRV